jgi:hypothetical protein
MVPRSKLWLLILNFKMHSFISSISLYIFILLISHIFPRTKHNIIKLVKRRKKTSNSLFFFPLLFQSLFLHLVTFKRKIKPKIYLYCFTFSLHCNLLLHHHKRSKKVYLHGKKPAKRSLDISNITPYISRIYKNLPRYIYIN